MHKIKKHAHKKTKQNENGIQPLQICAGGKKKKKKTWHTLQFTHTINVQICSTWFSLCPERCGDLEEQFAVPTPFFTKIHRCAVRG